MLLTYPRPGSSSLATVFKFTAGSIDHGPLSFPASAKVAPRSRKRTRALADIDDQPPGSKKKRRLRLLLITSRLSRPFSTPATHIVDRGPSRIAVWAKQKQLLPQALRKAAIMNRVRRKSLEREAWSRKDSGISVGEDERVVVRKAVLEGMKVEGPNAFGKALHPPTSVEYNPVMPSPLGLSNYDALDDEDGYYDDEHLYCSSCPNSPKKEKPLERKKNGDYYSDFNFFDHTPNDRESDEEYDDPFSLSVLPVEIVMDKRPPSPPDSRLLELMKEKEREREVLFLEFM
jgi:predicted small lipoprotein YifL